MFPMSRRLVRRRRPRLPALVALLTLIALPGLPAQARTTDQQSPRIIGGTMSPENAYSWMVFVLLDGTQMCGGSLISPTYVLTAANCVVDRKASGIKVIIGRSDWLEGGGGEERNVAEIKIHPLYKTTADDYSIALLRLSTPATAQPISIASPADRDLWMPGVTARLMGWGTVSTSTPWIAVLLNEVDIQVQKDSVMSASSAYGSRFHPATMLGAGPLSGGKGACAGDVGGPLVVQTRVGWRQIASFSWDDGCAAPNKPGVYVRLGAPAINDWIHQVAPDPVVDGIEGRAGDVNGDGKDDLVTFSRDSLRVYAAISTGTSLATSALAYRYGWPFPRSQTPLVGDVDGDHKADLIGFNRGSELGYVQVMTARSGSLQIWEPTFARGALTYAVGDFDGDGKDDIASFSRGDTADVFVGLSTGKNFGAATKWNDAFAPGAQIPLVGDFNGDGKDDIASLKRGDIDEVQVAVSTGKSFVPSLLPWQQWVASGLVTPAVGDFNGDGKDDIVLFLRGATTRTMVALSTGQSFARPVIWQEQPASAGEDTPGVGDVDGDGKDDILRYRPSSQGEVWVSLSSGSQFVVKSAPWAWGAVHPDEIPMPAVLW